MITYFEFFRCVTSVIHAMLNTCLGMPYYRDRYLQIKGYEDELMVFISDIGCRVRAEQRLNGAFLMSQSEIKESVSIFRFMTRDDISAVDEIGSIYGYYSDEINQTMTTLERSLECFDLSFRLYGPMHYKIISKDIINLSLNSSEQNILTQHLIYKMKIAKYAEEFIKIHNYSDDFLRNIEAIGSRILHEYYENHSFDVSKLEIRNILQVLRFIFISERSHAFPSTYKNHVISIIEGLQQAQLELE
jgi:hypothetical protein